MEVVTTDVLVIGSGAAGLRAAIEVRMQGLDVLLVTKTRLTSSASIMAEGGINAAISSVDKDDSWEKHFIDTVVAGAFLNDQDLVEVLTKEVIDRVYELEEWGAVFSRTEDGYIAQRPFGKQSKRRTCFATDRTGHEIVTTLIEMLTSLNVEFLEYHYVSKLLTSETSRIAGAIAWNVRSWEPLLIRCKAIVLATGGASQIYEVTTTPLEATGDGMVLAFDIGAELKDLEMIQFHPTGLAWPPSARGLLITEAVRGEGGILLNALGERFMYRYAPEELELAGRDVIARAIWREIHEGRGTEHGGVYLSITHKPCEYIKERLESTYRLLLRYGIDLCREPVEVIPTAHYTMGGVKIDINTATTIKGLFAAGEVTAGVHGANRLGGNSLADALVFGRRAGYYASQYARNTSFPSIDYNAILNEVSRVRSLSSKTSSDAVRYTYIRNKIKSIMWNYAAIIRNASSLARAYNELEELELKYLPRLRVEDSGAFSLEMLRALETINMLRISKLVVRSAMLRRESRGAHYREDYPVRDDRSWLKHIVVRKCRDGAITYRFEPVVITRLRPR